MLCCSGCCPELWWYGGSFGTATVIFIAPTPGGTVNSVTAALQQTAARAALGKGDVSEVVTPIHSTRSHHYMPVCSEHLVNSAGRCWCSHRCRGRLQPGIDALKHILPCHGGHPDDFASGGFTLAMTVLNHPLQTPHLEPRADPALTLDGCQHL